MYKIKDANDLARYFEYSNLNYDINKEEMIEFLEDAKTYEFHSVVVGPSFIKLAKEILKNTNIKVTTVIGFPLGFETTEMKVANAKIAIDDGADELDMVMNLIDLKSNDYESIIQEVKSVKEVLKDKPLKVIIESKILDDYQVINVSKAIEKAGADYIKTSSGFNGVNSFYEMIHDINIIKKNAPKIKIKASGGIDKYKDAYRILSAGVDKIGSSSAYEIIATFEKLISNEEEVKQKFLDV